MVNTQLADARKQARRTPFAAAIAPPFPSCPHAPSPPPRSRPLAPIQVRELSSSVSDRDSATVTLELQLAAHTQQLEVRHARSHSSLSHSSPTLL